MGLLGFSGSGLERAMEHYKQLCSYDRYDVLAELFRQENQRIFQLSNQSPFRWVSNSFVFTSSFAQEPIQCVPTRRHRRL